MIVSTGFLGLLILLVFLGGGFVVVVALSPLGRAIAERISHGGRIPSRDFTDLRDAQGAILDQLETLRADLSELSERVDFAERSLARGSQPANVTARPDAIH